MKIIGRGLDEVGDGESPNVQGDENYSSPSVGMDEDEEIGEEEETKNSFTQFLHKIRHFLSKF